MEAHLERAREPTVWVDRLLSRLTSVTYRMKPFGVALGDLPGRSVLDAFEDDQLRTTVDPAVLRSGKLPAFGVAVHDMLWFASREGDVREAGA